MATQAARKGADMAEKLMAALLGAVVGWTSTALTLVGRVDALEAGQGRIEKAVAQVLERVK